MCKQNINRDTKDLIDKQLSQRKANGNIQVEIMKRAKGVEQFIKPEGHEYLPDVELMYTTEENTLAVQKSKQANIEKKRK